MGEQERIQYGFQSVVVEKDALVSTLNSNKAKHVAEFSKSSELYGEALTAYFNGVKEEAEKSIKILSEKGKELTPRITTLIAVQKPVSHEKDYVMAIRMLEMSVDKKVQLSTQEFNQYVLDEWSWKQAFTSNFNAISSGCYISTSTF